MTDQRDEGILENVPEGSTVSLNPAARKRKEYEARRGKSRVNLYEQFVPWTELKSERNFDTHEQLAEFLINFYLSGRNAVVKCDAETQTDKDPLCVSSLLPAESPIRPIEPLMMSTPIKSTHDPNESETEETHGQTEEPSRKRRHLVESTISASTQSRFDASQDVERTLAGTEFPYGSSDDSEELNINEQSMVTNVDELKKISLEEEVFDTFSCEEAEEAEDPDLTDDPPPTANVPADVPHLQLVQMEKCIVFTDRILELLKMVHGVNCNRSDCCRQWQYIKTYVGSCLVVTWKCSSGHFGGSWSAQPLTNRMRAGNLLLSSCLLLSGNSYTKTALFFKFLNVKFISKSLFYQHQGLFIAPAVQRYWDLMRENLLDERKNKEILLSSDARNDSPGHCAQYCTYTIADMVDKVILQQNILDVREVPGRKSTNMETIGFQRGMDALLSTDIIIKEVITDGHTGIAALMSHSDKYAGIVHQRDVWHGGKSIGKKVTSIAKEKGNEDLTQWAGAVKNHFWYCSRHCDGNVDDFKDLWRGILHHVVNEHEWALDDGKSSGKCIHECLTEEERNKPWLKKNSKAHNALQKVVLSKRFLNTFHYYTNFRHTGFLESFHNHMLMYCPKRHAYSYVGYKLRNQLAVIDFNSHRNREPYRNYGGELVHRAQHSKRTKQWRPVAVLVPKEYAYIPSLIVNIFEEQVKTGTINQKQVRSEEDPRNIAPNIAMEPRPSVKQLLEVHKSRF